ncbi:MAG: hypothetical protein L3J34_04530 [Flavobacteriaceae bacterium]|nr:hypothetical protein [Flavobacteriaceae bacterium]
MKKTLIFCMLFSTCLIFSQEFKQEEIKVDDINPFRIGLKAGILNGIGGGIEYVTPLLGNRIALFADFGIMPISTFESTYFELGSNIYFNNKGKGGYISLSYGNLDAKMSELELDTDDGNILTNGVAHEKIPSYNVKLGVKFGKKLYFRMEGGYAIGSFPTEIPVTGDVDGNQETIIFDINEILDEYGFSLSGNGYILFNIGIGYSF